MTFPKLGNFKNILPFKELQILATSLKEEEWKTYCSSEMSWSSTKRSKEVRDSRKWYGYENSTFYYYNIEYLNCFSDEWFTALNCKKDDFQAKIILTKPGNIEPPHIDLYSTWLGDTVSEDEMSIKGKMIIRVWVPLFDSKLGHILFSDHHTLYDWSVGDVFEIPAGVTHGFVNAGRENRYLLSFTAMRF